MKKMRLAYIVWGIIVAMIIGLLTYLGFVYQKKLEPYKELEFNLKESAEKYVELEFLYPEEGQILEIKLEDIIKSGIIKELKYNDEACDGYVKLTYNGVYNYESYIKCPNYQTKNY